MFEIIIGAPYWVWGVLVYLLIVGVKASKTDIVSLPKLFILPLVLMALKYESFIEGHAVSYLTSIIIGIAVGLSLTYKADVKIFREKFSVEIPGTYSTLIILLSFFLVQYIFGYLESEMSELAYKYAFIELGLNGLFSGYFLGRSLGYLYKFNKNKTL